MNMISINNDVDKLKLSSSDNYAMGILNDRVAGI